MCVYVRMSGWRRGQRASTPFISVHVRGEGSIASMQMVVFPNCFSAHRATAEIGKEDDEGDEAARAAAAGAMSVLLPPLDIGRHGLEDVHFAVKGLLNAKMGG